METQPEEAAPHVDFIIKIGGAAITEKSSLATFNTASIAAICNQFVKLFQQCGREPRFVVCHGAGSFGHQYAKQFSVHLGASNSFSATGEKLFRNSPERLNELKTGLHTVCVPSFPWWVTSTQSDQKQSVVSADLSGMYRLLNEGFIPIIHGDCVLDVNQRYAILSGDLIVSHLAEKLKPKAVIFASDVAGVYTCPPFAGNGAINPEAVLIPEIHIDSTGKYSIPETSALSHDVTGGMLGKLECGRDIAVRGVPVYLTKAGSDEMFKICQAAVEDGLEQFQGWHGTKMLLKS